MKLLKQNRKSKSDCFVANYKPGTIMKKLILEYTFPIPITIKGKDYKVIKEIFDVNEIGRRATLQDIILLNNENQEVSLSSLSEGENIITNINVEHITKTNDFQSYEETIFTVTVLDDEI